MRHAHMDALARWVGLRLIEGVEAHGCLAAAQETPIPPLSSRAPWTGTAETRGVWLFCINGLAQLQRHPV